MWEILLRGIETCVVLGGSAAGIYSGKLWLQAQKHRSISEAKDEAIRVAQNNAEAWKSHYQAAHLELTNYRSEVHAKNNESNDRIIKLTSENSEWKAKTDLTPLTGVMTDFVQEQTRINGKVLEILTTLEERMKPRKGRFHGPRG